MKNTHSRNNFQDFIEKIKALPQPPTEESILLRILVQLMVIIGIIATDVAAQSTFPMSIWAIPLSIIGAIVSWQRRKKKNIALKFALAIGMLLALVFFLGNLFSNINDTRLILAELLIQLQILHSFDLPRRKDLGYSMIIGLILIGVSATLSQTLSFAPWLLLLLIVGIPTLILDYRSHIGLETWDIQWQQKRKTPESHSLSSQSQYSSLSLKKITSSIFIIILLGLFIFAIMPRYPGYQIQSFPVNAPDAFKNQQFNQGDKSVVNPGYNPDGTPRDSLIGEENNGGSNSNQDTSSYYGFNTKINQNFNNLITEKKLLFRVRSQYPGFWRVLAFDHYTGQGWEILREEQTMDIQRYRWSYLFRLSYPPIETETKKVIQTYTTVTDVPNIIPALIYPESIYFPSQEIAYDTEGGLRSPSGLIEGLTYTVISRVPYRNQTELQQAGNEYSELIEKYYLNMPSDLKTKVKIKAEELIAKSPRKLTSNYDIALYLAQAIKQNYVVPDDISEIALLKVEAFLSNGGGYPDQFATVYTLMLRSLDIPARLVVGFSSGQFNPFTGYYLVHNTDAYAMTEVYFPNYGWFYFDPLPGHEIIPISFQDDNPFGVLGTLWKWVAGFLPQPVTTFFTAVFAELTQAILGIFQSAWLGKLWQFFTGSLIGVLTGVVALIAVGFMGWLLFISLKQWSYRRYLNRLHPMTRLYQELLNLLADKGYSKKPYQTPYEFTMTLQNVFIQEQLEIIDGVTKGYVQWRYGKIEPNVQYWRSQFILLKKALHR
jgi:protein-glutamine gamma-glutamyltransferase